MKFRDQNKIYKQPSFHHSNICNQPLEYNASTYIIMLYFYYIIQLIMMNYIIPNIS